jgi:molybdopterin converting factor small subunit
LKATADNVDESAKQMNVHVQFYAQLRDLAGVSKLDVAISEGGTVADLLEAIYETVPKLRPHDKSTLIGAGVDFVRRDHVLSKGEEIAIMPPVQGG